jgi:transposase
MSRTRPPYPAEFRREAVSLLRSGARSRSRLAAESGCSQQTLRNWLRQEKANRGERSDVLTSDERRRLRELEREKSGAAAAAGDLEAGCGFLRQGDRGAEVRFRFVEAERAQFPVSLLCKTVGVTRGGFYA